METKVAFTIWQSLIANKQELIFSRKDLHKLFALNRLCNTRIEKLEKCCEIYGMIFTMCDSDHFTVSFDNKTPLGVINDCYANPTIDKLIMVGKMTTVRKSTTR